MVTKPQQQRVSFNPDTATQGFLDDVDVEITDAQCVEWDYNGNGPLGPAAQFEFTDSNGGTHEQYYSAGKSDDWKPTDDNTGFVPVSGKSGVNVQTNFMKFLASLVAVGFPKELLDDGNIKALVGARIHVKQVAQTRTTLVRQGKNADQPSTLLLVERLISLPGAQKASASTAKPASTTKAATGGKPNGQAAIPAKTASASTANDDYAVIDEHLRTALLELVSSSEGPVPKKELVPLAGRVFAEGDLKALRNKAIPRANQADFLATLKDAGIEYDGAQFTLAT